MSVIDALLFGCGIYIMYHSYIMKRDGVIPTGVMLSSGMIIPQDADVAGFILHMYGKGMIVGALACLSGLVGILSVRITSLQIIVTIFSLIFFVVFIAFIMALKKAHKKYLHIG